MNARVRLVLGGPCSRSGRGLFLCRKPIDVNEGAIINEPRINERIRVPEVRLVGPQGEQVGIVRIEDAMRLAQESDLDLVEVAPNSRPPVVKLMDYGKFKYEAAVKAREARRNQANTEIKEMRFRLKIDEHDYETKKGHVVRFLKGGDKVKVTIMFRGREQSRPEMGRRLLLKLADEVAEFAVVENLPSQEGRNMSLVLGPLKKKAEAKEEQRKAREAKKATENAERAERESAKDAEKEAAAPTEAPAEA
ncbi:translation initiation factor IF-3 [Demequina sp.]|uniref:translation initiation factor IF-3 n=1 Tax=Demequina sp. TaxID=2050685 RepID=UPI0025BE2DB2|nr:translation initiation factor IF-3 [Demequina sp.]